MAIMATDSGGSDFKLAEPGNHVAVCTLVADLGRQNIKSEKYGDSVKKQVYIRWELTDEPFEWQDKETGETRKGMMSLGKTYTLSLGDKAKLREHLESWRGRPFTEEERKGFDISKLAGVPCLINVNHATGSNDGKTRAVIQAVTPLLKGMEVPKPSETPYVFDDENNGNYALLPEWLRKKVDEQVAGESGQLVAEERGNAPFDPDLDDDVPF